MTKALFTLLVSMIALCNLHGQSPKSYEITPLCPNYYIYTTWQDIDSLPFPANGMYIVTDSGIVILDCPWDTAQAIPMIDSIEKKHGKKVVASVSTHYHGDRTASLYIFRSRGIKTYSSYQTLQLCKQKNEPQAQYIFLKDTVFDFGNCTIQTYYPGEGHSADNIVLWIPQRNILYGGCFIKSCEAASIGNVSDANLAAWSQSLLKVKNRFKQARFIITGHQNWLCSSSLEHTLKLLKEARH